MKSAWQVLTGLAFCFLWVGVIGIWHITPPFTSTLVLLVQHA